MSGEDLDDVERDDDEEEMSVKEARDDIFDILSRVREAADSAESSVGRVMEASNKITEILASAEEAATSLSELKESAAGSNSGIEADEAAVQKLRAQARADYDRVKDLSEKAEQLESSITKGMETLEELTRNNISLKEKIESLLPGATSTGLAKSFMDRKREYKWPRRWWTVTSRLLWK